MLFCCILAGLGGAGLAALAGFGGVAIFGAYVLGGLAGALGLAIFTGIDADAARGGVAE